MANIVNQIAAVVGWQDQATLWNENAPYYIWNNGGQLNTVGISIDCSALDIGDTINTAVLALPYNADQSINATYEFSVQIADASNPAVFSGANLPRSVASFVAGSANESFAVAQTGTLNLDIAAILAALVTSQGAGNIGNVNLVVSQVTDTANYVSFQDNVVLDVTVNAGGDVTAPTVSSATIDAAGTSLTIGLDEGVDFGAGGNSGFALSTGQSLTYASGSGTASLVYTISPAVSSVETPTLAYTQPGNGVQDLAVPPNDLVTFSGQAVTNNSTVTQGSINLNQANDEIRDLNYNILASQTGLIADVYSLTNGALIARVTGLSTNVSGILSIITDVAIVAAINYDIIIRGFSGGESAYVRNRTAS